MQEDRWVKEPSESRAISRETLADVDFKLILKRGSTEKKKPKTKNKTNKIKRPLLWNERLDSNTSDRRLLSGCRRDRSSVQYESREAGKRSWRSGMNSELTRTQKKSVLGEFKITAK